MECGSVEFYTHVSYWRGGIVGFSVGCVRSSLLPSLCSPNFSDVVCDMFAVGFFCTDISGAKLLGFSVEFVRSRVLHPRFWGPNYLGLVCGMFADRVWRSRFCDRRLGISVRHVRSRVCTHVFWRRLNCIQCGMCWQQSSAPRLLAFSMGCVRRNVLHLSLIHI